MPFRDAASSGKRQELAAIAELLRRGFDVYRTLVDDQRIDCVIREDAGGAPVYVDVQIKARSRDCRPKTGGTFAALEVRNPRPNFFFIFYSEHADDYWVVPSMELVREARRIKTGKAAGRYTIALTNVSGKTGKVVPRPRFDKYRNNFDVLRMGGEMPSFEAPVGIEELASVQGVSPVANFDELLGDFWPEDESPDEFIAAVRDWRREGARAPS